MTPGLLVLCGGRSSEREVSLRSGAAAAAALPGSRLVVLDEDALPAWVDPALHAVLPMMHGGWGEGGGLQAELEARGVAFAGSGSEASRLCMDKVATKARLRAAGLPVAPELAFDRSAPPAADAVVAALGTEVFLKPSDQGSSVGTRRAVGEPAIAAALASLPVAGRWMAEPLLRGRELTVGLLAGRAMGVVEIVAAADHYDYDSKYTPGGSRHLAPAPIPEDVRAAVAAAAERAFAACGCRDVARVDVILRDDGAFHLLEVNTLPGMTELSLLPDSARCAGLSYADLARRLAQPALDRAARR